MNNMKLYIYKEKGKKKLVEIFRLILLIGLCFIILYPFFIKLSTSFMQTKDLYDATVIYLPRNFTWSNITRAIEDSEYFTTLLTTTIFTLFLSILQILSCLLVGYGFARFEFPFKKVWFVCVIITLIMPLQNIMAPLYFYFKNFNFFGLLGEEGFSLIGSPVPLMLLSATCLGLRNGLYIYMFRQYFKGFPKELDESGQIDGANTFQIFSRIILPSGTSMIITCFLFSFVWQWTDTFYTSIFMPDNSLLQTKMVGLAGRFNAMLTLNGGARDPYYASIFANVAILLLVLPLLILYLFTQRYFVESIERSGIVG